MLGAGLSNQLNNPIYKEKYTINPKAINLGISGEKETSKILRKWMADKPEVVLLDSISLPLKEKENIEEEYDEESGEIDRGDTDHVLIIGDHIIIIDSKNWKSKASYTVLEDGSILRSKKYFKGGKPKINQMKFLWNKYFENYDINKVHAFVCISSKEPIIIRDRNWWQVGFMLVNHETLIKFLDQTYEKIMTKDFIRTELVALTLKGLIKPFNKYEKGELGLMSSIANGKLKLN